MRGLKLPEGALIEILVLVYGTHPRPGKRRYEGGQTISQILLQVDDFIVAAKKEILEQVRKALLKRFKFGKWEVGSAEYSGRNIRTDAGYILIDQEKHLGTSPGSAPGQGPEVSKKLGTLVRRVRGLSLADLQAELVGKRPGQKQRD